MTEKDPVQTQSKRGLRIANGLFWLAVWAVTVTWSGTYGHWVPMILEGFVPLMLWGSVHIALRAGGPEA